MPYIVLGDTVKAKQTIPALKGAQAVFQKYEMWGDLVPTTFAFIARVDSGYLGAYVGGPCFSQTCRIHLGNDYPNKTSAKTSLGEPKLNVFIEQAFFYFFLATVCGFVCLLSTIVFLFIHSFAGILKII